MLSNFFKNTARLLLLIAFTANAAFAQTTTFTYQGSLAIAGTPTNSNHDFEFKLFDLLAGGTQQGSTAQSLNVAVTNGIFAVSISFGACPTCFNGANRFLEISVRPAGGGAFTTLSPRQQVTSTPYAIKSSNAAAADDLSTACVNCVRSSQILSVQGSQVTGSLAGSQITGAIPVASVPAGSVSYIQNTGIQQATSNFNISGNGTLGGTLTANTINATGFVSGFHLTSTEVVNAGIQFNIGNTRILSKAGTGNLFAGESAGANNTSGNSNSFFGALAGVDNQTGSSNSFFGVNAGLHNTASDNSFFGRQAGFTNVSGSSNSFFGSEAGFLNTAGFNSFFGAQAGHANSTGTQNSFFGYDTGLSNTTGGSNSFFGYKAGEQNTAGFNSFFGATAGQANTNGSNNAFFGHQAGSVNTSGGENSFLGSKAGGGNTTGVSNSFIGTFAGRDNNGDFNSFFGESAGVLNSTGARNTFIGRRAGESNTSGGSNTILGDQADVASANLNNAAAIGALASVSQNNSLVLGSINGVNGATADTKVGIGTTAPVAALNVIAFSTNAADNTATFKATNIGPNQSHIHFGTTGNWFIRSAASTGRVTLQDTGGNVGIGTSTANAKLQVTGGNIYITAPSSLIITSPNGACWFITVNNSGLLSTNATTCP